MRNRKKELLRTGSTCSLADGGGVLQRLAQRDVVDLAAHTHVFVASMAAFSAPRILFARAIMLFGTALGRIHPSGTRAVMVIFCLAQRRVIGHTRTVVLLCGACAYAFLVAATRNGVISGAFDGRFGRHGFPA